MTMFRLSPSALDTTALRLELSDPSCGGLVFFEGHVRDHNEGRVVTALEYEAFAPLAIKEGERILREAVERFGVVRALCAHRVGALEVGGIAVFIGIAAGHRFFHNPTDSVAITGPEILEPVARGLAAAIATLSEKQRGALGAK